jgi:hypothetical protein
LVLSLLWYSIKPNTCKIYALGTKLWEFFYATRAVVLYLAQLPNLMEWVVQRIYSNSSPYIGRVTLKTLYLYLTAIRFIYIDYIFLVIVFENVSICYILDRVTSLNPNLKEATLKLLILYSILTKIVISSNLIPKVNTNTAFCLAFTGYLCIREISYTNK